MQEGEDFIANAGSYGLVPIGDQDAVEWSFLSVLRWAHGLNDRVGDDLDLSNPICLRDPGRQSGNIDPTDNIRRQLRQGRECLEHTGLERIEDHCVPLRQQMALVRGQRTGETAAVDSKGFGFAGDLPFRKEFPGFLGQLLEVVFGVGWRNGQSAVPLSISLSISLDHHPLSH